MEQIKVSCEVCHEEFEKPITSRKKICSPKCHDRKKYLNHKDTMLAQRRAYYQSHSEASKTQCLARRRLTNGWSVEEYNAALKEQEEKCILCGKHQDDNGKALCADHNHETGKKRGLLCNDCNRALGLFQDSSALLLKAANYLQSY